MQPVSLAGVKSFLPIRVLFLATAAYDGLLGLAFIVAAPQIFAWMVITPPNHWGYVHFAAGMLVIFGWMFLQIALRPVENRKLIDYGIMLKLCYVATVAWHWAHGGLPDLWKWFAFVDTATAVLFVWSRMALRSAVVSGPNESGP